MDSFAKILTLIADYVNQLMSFNPNSPLLFTQFHFWAFFAMVFCIFAILKNRPSMRNTYLFFISLLFYYKTCGLFVGMLIIVTISDYWIARGIYRMRNKSKWKQRFLLCLSVCIDLSILCYFKYSYFIADFINSIFGTTVEVKNFMAEAGNSIIGKSFFSVDKIILPVGISFYTFQIISYTCDVYKGIIKPVRNILDFGFYVSFFPQLVSGPIVKASDFIPQLYRKYHLSRLQFGIAVFWIINGLLKKIVLSDYLAVNYIDRVFENPHLFTGFENLMALFLYSLQVYADFSGYTDIAIGLSLLFGFYLPKNFNSPYKATNCANFWKRWHISLSRWLQTYLYIPLGGNRNISFGTYFWIIFITIAALVLCGNWWITLGVAIIGTLVVLTAWRYPEKCRKIYANLNAMITMLMGGLWHGASMNFIMWGGLNGIGMVIFKFWRDMSLKVKALVSTLVLEVMIILSFIIPGPLCNILIAFMLIICVSMWICCIYKLMGWRYKFSWLAHGWSVIITFIFITFTRLFFRSGSNLDPAVANKTAWSIASRMVESIGTKWDINIWPIIMTYHNVFLLFIAGMIIHWLPTKVKQKYRVCFAKLPIGIIGLCVVGAVFLAYQFVSAKLQPFIYFQF